MGRRRCEISQELKLEAGIQLEAEIATGVLKQGRERWEVEGVRYPRPHPLFWGLDKKSETRSVAPDDWTSHTCSQPLFNSDIVIGDAFPQ